MNVPQHIAIIMDGNGRWAKAQGKVRTFGHQAGAETLKTIVKIVTQIGVVGAIIPSLTITLIYYLIIKIEKKLLLLFLIVFFLLLYFSYAFHTNS